MSEVSGIKVKQQRVHRCTQYDCNTGLEARTYVPLVQTNRNVVTKKIGTEERVVVFGRHEDREGSV